MWQAKGEHGTRRRRGHGNPVVAGSNELLLKALVVKNPSHKPSGHAIFAAPLGSVDAKILSTKPISPCTPSEWP